MIHDQFCRQRCCKPGVKPPKLLPSVAVQNDVQRMIVGAWIAAIVAGLLLVLTILGKW